MNESSVIQRLIGAIKDQQTSIAEASMTRPKRELFDIGEQAGRYQGLQMALDNLQNILSDSDEKENYS